MSVSVQNHQLFFFVQCDEESSKGKKGSPKPIPQAYKRWQQQDESLTPVTEGTSDTVTDQAAALRLSADVAKDTLDAATITTQVVPDTTHSQASNTEDTGPTGAITQDEVRRVGEVNEDPVPFVSCFKPPRESGITALLEATSKVSSKVKRGKAAGGGADPCTATRSSEWATWVQGGPYKMAS